MTDPVFAPLSAAMRGLGVSHRTGVVTAIGRHAVEVGGLDDAVSLGDRVRLSDRVTGEVLRIGPTGLVVLPEGSLDGVRLGAPVRHVGPPVIAPDPSWLGRVIDPDGAPLDGRPLMAGGCPRPLVALPPSATARRALGPRLDTGLAVFDTFLPLVRGQRIGLFAGSGVGKSRLIASLATGIPADVVVIGLIGERGREVREFATEVLTACGAARAVIVAATSDRPALERARCGWTMMTVAEFFRDAGAHVLLLADSITRFAEAQAEVAAAVGEPFGPSGFPASMAQMIMALSERAGPGAEGQGDITAVLSVLVAGSDMDGPVADVMRGVLDGHVVLDRGIAERGRYPAIDLLRSVSRALPAAASPEENTILTRARQLLGAYDRAALMVQSGLYTPGADALTDAAVRAWPDLDAFVGAASEGGITGSFDRLAGIIDRARAPAGPQATAFGAADRA